MCPQVLLAIHINKAIKFVNIKAAKKPTKAINIAERMAPTVKVTAIAIVPKSNVPAIPATRQTPLSHKQ